MPILQFAHWPWLVLIFASDVGWAGQFLICFMGNSASPFKPIRWDW
jgi:hypothetical protein